MKYKFLFGWVLFCILMIVFIGYSFHLYGVADRQAASKKEIQLRIEREDETLKNWVMARSNRISETTAKGIVAECRKTPHQLFLIALIGVESSFVPSALSNKEAMGLGQIMKVHVPILIGENIIKDRRDLFDIAPNIQATSFVFRTLYKQHKYNLHKTVSAYLGKQDKKYFEDIMENYFELMALITQVRENK